MSSKTATAASVAFEDGTLFIQYMTPANNLGTLFTLSPPALSNGNGNSASSLIIQPQTIVLQGSSTLNTSLSQLTLSSASMAYTSTQNSMTNSYRHDLLLTINTVEPLAPTILRLSLSSNTSTWTTTDQSSALGVTFDSRRIWLATGDVSPGGTEGSALFLLYSSSAMSSNLQKLNLSGQTPSQLPKWPITIDFYNNPKIVRLRDQDLFDVAAIGSCTSSPYTCVFLATDQEALELTTNIPYDPTSCTTAANGSLIMASTSGIWTLSYNTMSGTWINHQPLPNLPTPILTCTVANSKLYAVLQGDAQLPAIRSIDLTSSSWNWQQVQLTVTSGNGGSEGNSSIISSSSSKKLSTGVIVAIVVIVVVLLILGIAFFWWRRRKSSSHMKEIEKAEAVPESIPVYPAPYNASQLINTSQPTPVLATQQAESWATQPNKQELFGYGQSQPSVSTPWSPANAAIVDTSYRDPNYQQLHTARNPLTVATTMSSQYAPSTTSSGVVAGDKQELTSEDNLVTLTPSTVNSFPSQLSPNASGSGIAQPITSAPFNNLAPPNEPRLREVLSPGLANAQLILQQSQTPQR